MTFRSDNTFERLSRASTKSIAVSPLTAEIATHGARSIVDGTVDSDREGDKDISFRRTVSITDRKGSRITFEQKVLAPLRKLTAREDTVYLLVEANFDTVKGHEQDEQGLSIVTLAEVKQQLGIVQSYDAEELMARVADHLSRVRGSFPAVKNFNGKEYVGEQITGYFVPTIWRRKDLKGKKDDKGNEIDAFMEVKFHPFITSTMRDNMRLIIPWWVLQSINLNSYRLMPKLIRCLCMQCKMNTFGKDQPLTLKALMENCGTSEADLKKNKNPIREIKYLLNHLQELKNKWVHIDNATGKKVSGFDYKIEGKEAELQRFSEAMLNKRIYFTFPNDYQEQVRHGKATKAKTIENAIKQSKKKKGRRTKKQEPTTNQPPREITADSFKI